MLTTIITSLLLLFSFTSYGQNQRYINEASALALQIEKLVLHREKPADLYALEMAINSLIHKTRLSDMHIQSFPYYHSFSPGYLINFWRSNFETKQLAEIASQRISEVEQRGIRRLIEEFRQRVAMRVQTTFPFDREVLVAAQMFWENSADATCDTIWTWYANCAPAFDLQIGYLKSFRSTLGVNGQDEFALEIEHKLDAYTSGWVLNDDRYHALIKQLGRGHAAALIVAETNKPSSLVAKSYWSISGQELKASRVLDLISSLKVSASNEIADQQAEATAHAFKAWAISACLQAGVYKYDDYRKSCMGLLQKFAKPWSSSTVNNFDWVAFRDPTFAMLIGSLIQLYYEFELNPKLSIRQRGQDFDSYTLVIAMIADLLSPVLQKPQVRQTIVSKIQSLLANIEFSAMHRIQLSIHLRLFADYQDNTKQNDPASYQKYLRDANYDLSLSCGRAFGDILSANRG